MITPVFDNHSVETSAATASAIFENIAFHKFNQLSCTLACSRSRATHPSHWTLTCFVGETHVRESCCRSNAFVSGWVGICWMLRVHPCVLA